MTQSQGNPWQGNLYFHGFTLSPLLGSPSGISVYMDGVRQNEPFAETDELGGDAGLCRARCRAGARIQSACTG